MKSYTRERLIALLETGDLSRDELAANVGVTPAVIDGWVDGTNTPSRDQERALNELFNPYPTKTAMEVRAAVLMTIMHDFGWECSTLVPKKKKLDS